jgi:outer membrane receptor protein involved in Fe transport
MQRNIQPAKTFPARFTAAFDNDLFNGRVKAQSVIGADYTKLRSAYINYSYYLADASGNPVVTGLPTSANNGRTPMPPIIWAMGTQPPGHPWFAPGTGTVTVAGRNYILMQSNPANVVPRTDDNPHGVNLGQSNYNVVNIENKGVFGATDLNWGKWDGLLGFRYMHAYSRTDSQGSPLTAFNTETGARKISDGKFFSYSAGLNYAWRDWLRPYVNISDSHNFPIATNNDPLGVQTEAAHAVGTEAGIKVQNRSGSLSGSLAVYHTSAKNENYFVTSQLSFYINPSGLNGRFGGAPSTIINVDREAEGVQLALTASPTRNWRLRFSAATISGETATTKSYPQVYNDQFYANAQGQVTYKNGQVVYVPAAFSSTNLTVAPTTAGAQPLTIAMLSDPRSPYYTQPMVISGAITPGSAGGRVLLASNALTAANGPILTGATGLPISQIQINPGFTPPGNIPLTKSGEGTTNYPTLSANLTSVYTFSDGWLRGFRAGGSAFVSWKNRKYYYYPNGITVDGERDLFSLPTLARFDLILGHERRIGRYTVGFQLNVRNMFNHYKVIITPNNVTGYAGPNNAIFSAEPRAWEFTTTLGF